VFKQAGSLKVIVVAKSGQLSHFDKIVEDVSYPMPNRRLML
jgi:hypothetical protein